jgi:hypothetical protein
MEFLPESLSTSSVIILNFSAFCSSTMDWIFFLRKKPFGTVTGKSSLETGGRWEHQSIESRDFRP